MSNVFITLKEKLADGTWKFKYPRTHASAVYVGSNNEGNVETALANKADKTTTYTKAEIDTKVEDIGLQISGKYTKPSTGIPSTDLASGVQTSLSRADEIYNDYIDAQNLI